MRRAGLVAALSLAAAIGSACLDLPAGAEDPLPLPVSQVQLGPPQYRALWVDAFHDGIKSELQIRKLVADAHRANVNALFVQVRKAGDAYFNKADEPRASDIEGPVSFDPLATLIQFAHAENPRIEVHAWLNTFFVGDGQVYKDHAQFWASQTDGGDSGGFFDPGVPEQQTYTHKVFMDVAMNYDVDGLHMDFVRYPTRNWGYNANALALFQRETGYHGTPPADDPTWSQWRRDQVTHFVKSLHDDLHAQKPGVKLSGAFICYGGGPSSDAAWVYTSAYTSVFQDWRLWLAENYVDLGVPMNYDSEWDPREAGWFNAWIRWEKNSTFNNRVLVGVGAFLSYPEEAIAQIQRVLAPTPEGRTVLGVAIYSYASTSVYGADEYYANADYANALPRQPYFDGISDPDLLAERGDRFNDWFMTELALPDSYRDPQLGWVHTKPVFMQPAAIPPPA
jgi:uncharacterized lipoprotein YddW (UPF0748 family)